MQFRYLFLLTTIITILYIPTTFADSVTTYSDSSLSTVSTYFNDGATVYVTILDSDEQGSSRPATIIPDSSGVSINITVYDDGTRNDATSSNGVYSGNFTIGTTASSNTTYNLQLDDGENATVTSAGLASTVNATIRADYTTPLVTIATPSAGNYGPTVDINVNVTEKNSGIKFSKYWFDLLDGANTTKTDLSCSTITGTEVKNCTVSYNSSSTTAGVYTVWVNTSDNAGNVDLSSVPNVVINNTVLALYITYTNQNNKRDWFLNRSDNFTISGNVTDASGNAVTSTVSATLTLEGATISNSSQSVYTTENYNFDFGFTGASIGVGTLSITATDASGNAATLNKNVYITRDLGQLEVKIVSSQTYYDRQDNPTIKVTAKDDSGNAVYNATVTISIPYGTGSSTDLSTSGVTGTDGIYQYTWDIPDDSTQGSFDISVSGYSQIANSTTISNSSALTVSLKYIDIYLSLNDTDPHANESIKVIGHLDASFGNQTFVREKSGIVSYQIYLNNNESNQYKTWTTLSTDFNQNFSFVFTPPHKRAYWVRVNATVPYKDSAGNTFTIYSTKTQIINIGDEMPVYNETTETTTVETNKSFAVVSYPTLVEIEQGKIKELQFTVKNSGEYNLTTINATLSGVGWPDWYIITEEVTSVGINETKTIRVNISVSSNTVVAEYNITLKVTAGNLSDEISFPLKVMPSETTKSQLEKSSAELQKKISALDNALTKLSRKVNNTNIQTAIEKMIQAKTLINESKTAISEGDYFTAAQNENEIIALSAEIDAIIKQEREKTRLISPGKRNAIIIILLIFAVIGGLVYYMWLPERGGYIPKKDSVFSTKEESFAERLKDKLKKVLEKINK